MVAREHSREEVDQQYNLVLNGQIPPESRPALQARAQERILQSLRFDSMNVRVEAVSQAHARTFDWIFQYGRARSPVKGDFVEWLSSKGGIFWISGKAGSGKSTLMKFLYDHQSTQSYLRVWAGNYKLLTANYFFWDVGNSMQKSIQGLFQSLLHKVFKDYPELLPVCCPERWRLRVAPGEEEAWTMKEISQTMNRLKQQSQVTARFCFFIDGLDEYEGYHRDINETLRDLSDHPNFKICLSSRPWNVFEDCFGSDVSRKLYVHDLTSEDIELYVKKNLEKHANFVASSAQDANYMELVRSTVERSQGVFL